MVVWRVESRVRLWRREFLGAVFAGHDPSHAVPGTWYLACISFVSARIVFLIGVVAPSGKEGVRGQ